MGLLGIGAVMALAIGLTILLAGIQRGTASPADPAVESIQDAASQRAEHRDAFRSIEGAIRFPAGVAYPQALRVLLLAEVTGRSTMAVDVAPSPAGDAVLATTGTPEGRVTIDLSAPYGFDPVNGPLAPTFMFPEGTTPSDQRSDAGPWLAGARLGIPVLPPCMVIRSPADRPARECSAGDVPSIDPRVEPFVSLP